MSEKDKFIFKNLETDTGSGVAVMEKESLPETQRRVLLKEIREMQKGMSFLKDLDGGDEINIDSLEADDREILEEWKKALEELENLGESEDPAVKKMIEGARERYEFEKEMLLK